MSLPVAGTIFEDGISFQSITVTTRIPIVVPTYSSKTFFKASRNAATERPANLVLRRGCEPLLRDTFHTSQQRGGLLLASFVVSILNQGTSIGSSSEPFAVEAAVPSRAKVNRRRPGPRYVHPCCARTEPPKLKEPDQSTKLPRRELSAAVGDPTHFGCRERD